jgi:hypothetical protein
MDLRPAGTQPVAQPVGRSAVRIDCQRAAHLPMDRATMDAAHGKPGPSVAAGHDDRFTQCGRRPLTKSNHSTVERRLACPTLTGLAAPTWMCVSCPEPKGQQSRHVCPRRERHVRTVECAPDLDLARHSIRPPLLRHEPDRTAGQRHHSVVIGVRREIVEGGAAPSVPTIGTTLTPPTHGGCKDRTHAERCRHQPPRRRAIRRAL